MLAFEDRVQSSIVIVFNITKMFVLQMEVVWDLKAFYS